MKITRTKLKIAIVSKNDIVTLINMLNAIYEKKELLIDVRTLLVNDESYPKEFAVQTGQIDEQISYYDFNIKVLIEALKQKGHTYIPTVFVEDDSVVVTQLTLKPMRHLTEEERKAEKIRINNRILEEEIKFIDNDGLSKADMNDAINNAIDSHTEMKNLINK